MDEKNINEIEVNDVESIVNDMINERNKWLNKEQSKWFDPDYQFSHRITNVDTLYEIVSYVIDNTLREGNEIQKKKALITKKILNERYNSLKNKENRFLVSVLPYNIANALLKKDPALLLKYFPISVLFKDNYSKDPYGLFKKSSLIKVMKNGKEIAIATRTFNYAVLFNITYTCPIGCAGCYKGGLTRLRFLDGFLKTLKEETRDMSLEQRTDYLVEWLKMYGKDVDTIVISGGEPFLYPPQEIKKLLLKLSEVPNLKKIRICTSSVFQGMFFVFNDEMLKVLKEVTEIYEKKGKVLIFNTHATNETQLLSEESKYVIEKLSEVGVKGFYVQMPLQEGINFWKEDVDLSYKQMKEITDTMLYLRDVYPYKLIVDMHSPVDKNITVPIESVLKVVDKMESHVEVSDMNRWQAINVLTPFGNAYLNASISTKLYKEIRENDVLYFFVSENTITIYKEPLIEGVNDKYTFPPIEEADESTKSRLLQLKEKYEKFERTEDEELFSHILNESRRRPVNPTLEVGVDDLKEKAIEFSNKLKIRQAKTNKIKEKM